MKLGMVQGVILGTVGFVIAGVIFGHSIGTVSG